MISGRRMRQRGRQWLSNNVDVLVFAAALLGVGLLMIWWGTLVRLNILEMHALQAAQLQQASPDAQQQTLRLAELGEQTRRKLFMVTGESTMAGVLFATFTLLLFIIARRRTAAARRMRSLLQFTSHELKTPIAAVRGLLQSLQLDSIPAAQRAQLIERGVQECDRLEHLTETILAYQRAMSRALQLHVHSGHALLRSVLEHRQRTLTEERIHWQPAAEVSVRADADSFRVILENLLDNARKYAQGEVWLSERIEAQQWQLAIGDRGAGFHADDAQSLFDPFARSARAGGLATHGAGLGLYIARRLAREMGGELTAASAGPGQGSTFTLALRLAANGGESGV